MDEKIRQQLVDALNKGARATREDLLKQFTMEVTVNKSWEMYCNPRITAGIDSLSPREVTHLIFTPVVEAGMVIIQAGTDQDEGAEPLNRRESGRTGLVRVRSALTDFGVEIPRDRNLKFAIETAELPVGDGLQKVLLIRVKKPKRKRVVTRPSNLTPEQKAEQLQARRQRAAERKANPSRQAGRAGDQPPTGQPTGAAGAEGQQTSGQQTSGQQTSGQQTGEAAASAQT